MDWLALTFVSIIFRSFYGLMTKIMSNKMKSLSVHGQAAALPLAAAVISILISPLVGGFSISNKFSFFTVILVVLGQGLGNITYFEAIKSLHNSTAQIAFSSILIFNTIFSVLFLNLRLTPLNFMGIFLLMGAILMVVAGKMEFNKKGIFWMVISAALFAVFQLSSSELSKQVSAASYLVIAYLGAALVVILIKFKDIKKDLKTIIKNPEIGRVPFYTASFSLGNFIFAYWAYRSAPQASKVAILLTSQVVLTVILSYFFLKEKNHLMIKLFAGILVIIAAFLIKG